MLGISSHPFAALLDKAARTIRDPVAGVVASTPEEAISGVAISRKAACV